MSTFDEAFADAFPSDPAETPAEPEASVPEVTPEETPEAPAEETAPVAEAETPKAEEATDVQKFLDRFGGDVDKALEAAVHADSMIGRQGQQMGELKKELENLRESLQPEEPEYEFTQQHVDWLDEQVATNPYQAAEWARANDKTGALLDRVLNEWYEIPGESRRAAQYERALEYQSIQQQQQQSIAPLQAQAVYNQFSQVWSQLNKEIPDLMNYGEQIQEAAVNSPEIVMELRQGTPEAQARVVRNLYKLAKFDELASKGANGAEPTPPVDTSAEEQRSGFVASGSSVQEPETKSANDLWVEENLDPWLEQYFGSGFQNT